MGVILLSLSNERLSGSVVRSRAEGKISSSSSRTNDKAAYERKGVYIMIPCHEPKKNYM